MTASTTGSRPEGKRRVPVKLLTVLGLLLAWQALALRTPEVLIPSPLDTLRAASEIVWSGELVNQLSRSLLRMLLGFAIGASAAVFCGLAAGGSAVVYDAFRPVQSVLLGTPPIIIVVLALIWFGTGGVVPVFVVAILVFPLIFLNTADGRRSVDRQLLEMSAVYDVPWWRRMRHIILPALAVPVFTAVSLASGVAVRITIMAELLGADDGAGYMIALARTNLETAEVFAWAVILVALVILLDYAVITPLKQFTGRWESETREKPAGQSARDRPEVAAGS